MFPLQTKAPLGCEPGAFLYSVLQLACDTFSRPCIVYATWSDVCASNLLAESCPPVADVLKLAREANERILNSRDVTFSSRYAICTYRKEYSAITGRLQGERDTQLLHAETSSSDG